jgi:hypothetical protein
MSFTRPRRKKMSKRNDKRREEAASRNEAYNKLTLDQKIERLTKAGHNCKQLQKLLKQKEELEAQKEKKDVDGTNS